MKAWVLHGINDFRLEEVPCPVPKEDEELVQVKCAGVCSSDIQRIFLSGAYHYPIILGHEFSGITQDGRQVGVFPLLPCFKCESCKQGIYETCSDYGYIGSRQNGAFAEYVAVSKWNLIELPSGISFEQGAMLEPIAVALHASKIAKNARNTLVVGNGTIGKLIAQWIQILGGKATLIGRNDSHRQKYECCMEVVGTLESLQRCVELVEPNGQIVLVGNPAIDFSIDQKLYWQILRKQLVVKGSWNSCYPDDWQAVIEAISQKDIFTGEFTLQKCEFDKLGETTASLHNKLSRGKIYTSI